MGLMRVADRRAYPVSANKYHAAMANRLAMTGYRMARSPLSASSRARIVSSSTVAGSGSSQPYATHTARSSAACAYWSQVGRAL